MTTTEMFDSVTKGGVTMTNEHDGTWTCSAGCPFVFQVDEFMDDVAYHLKWHARQGSSVGRPSASVDT